MNGRGLSTISVTSACRCSAGEELCIDYGVRGSHQLLRRYGFIPQPRSSPPVSGEGAAAAKGSGDVKQGDAKRDGAGAGTARADSEEGGAAAASVAAAARAFANDEEVRVT